MVLLPSAPVSVADAASNGIGRTYLFPARWATGIKHGVHPKGTTCEGTASVRPPSSVFVGRREKVVLGGEQRRGRSGRDANLVVDVLDVMFGRSPGDVQAFGDLPVRVSGRHQAEGFYLPLAEASRSLVTAASAASPWRLNVPIE
jgi:hypothetical protein